MAELITGKYLDEERFARSYARGKFGVKQWGRLRIRGELKRRDISDYCIHKAMSEINPKDYLLSLEQVLIKRNERLKMDNVYERKQKLVNYAIGRGYESELIWPIVDRIIPIS